MCSIFHLGPIPPQIPKKLSSGIIQPKFISDIKTVEREGKRLLGRTRLIYRKLTLGSIYLEDKVVFEEGNNVTTNEESPIEAQVQTQVEARESQNGNESSKALAEGVH